MKLRSKEFALESVMSCELPRATVQRSRSTPIRAKTLGLSFAYWDPAPTISKRVDDPVTIAAGPTQFVTFFSLGTACHRGIAQVLGSAPIPKEFHEFPRFRQALRLDPRSTAPCNWMIWDGREEWVIPRLNEEQRRYPIRSIVNDTLLVERALSGWTSDLDT